MAWFSFTIFRPLFSPKLFTIFLPYGLEGNAHTFASWRYGADIFCTNGPSKSFAPQESEPRIHNGPHPAFWAPPVILSHTVQLPSPQRLGSFWTWGYFSSSFQTFPRSWQKKKKKNSHLLQHPHNPPFLFPNPIFLFSRCHPHRCLAQNLFCGIIVILSWHSSPCYSLELWIQMQISWNVLCRLLCLLQILSLISTFSIDMIFILFSFSLYWWELPV